VVKSCVQTSAIDPNSILGLGFDATCSLAVFDLDGKPVSVVAPDFDETSEDVRNVILWLDHRPELETVTINATKHNLLRYVGGTMSIEMEMPKILWLKRNMPKELFSKCVFYDLSDALVHLATGFDSRSFCSTVCKQGYVPVGVDGSVKGWQAEFLYAIGLGELCEDNFKHIGGVDGVVNLLVKSLEPN
jgi:FGGY-family pentulose kinase